VSCRRTHEVSGHVSDDPIVVSVRTLKVKGACRFT